MNFVSRTPVTPGRSFRRRSGFTILEVAIAASVMAITISGAIVVIQSGFKALDNARNTTLSSQIMQSEMERIRLLNWSTLPASGRITLSEIFPTGTTTTTSMDARFLAMRTCTDVVGKEGEMKSITITVSWTGLDNSLHTRSTTTYYCKDGLYDYYYTLATPSS